MTLYSVLKLTTVLMVLLLSAPSIAASTIDRTIAKINDDILTESDLAEVAADASGEFTAKGRNGFSGATSETVKSMLDRALLLQEARRLKITPDSEELHRQVEAMVRDISANFASETEFHHALAAERLSLDQLKKDLLEKTKTDYMVFHVISSQFSVSEDEVDKYKSEQTSAGEVLQSYRLRRLGIPVKEGGSSEAAAREARALVARIITSGPTPPGSPMLIAMRGFTCARPQTRGNAAAEELAAASRVDPETADWPAALVETASG